jgi:hypothetical protein
MEYLQRQGANILLGKRCGGRRSLPSGTGLTYRLIINPDDRRAVIP